METVSFSETQASGVQASGVQASEAQTSRAAAFSEEIPEAQTSKAAAFSEQTPEAQTSKAAAFSEETAGTHSEIVYTTLQHSEHPVVRLRPHHLLCLQNFRGKGYSPAFVTKMKEVSRLLHNTHFESGDCSRRTSETTPAEKTAHPAAIRLVKGADDLCASCPNCSNRHCTSENPGLFDSLVLDVTGLSYDQLLPNGLRSAGVPAMSPNLLRSCCPGCNWFSLCMDICTGKTSPD